MPPRSESRSDADKLAAILEQFDPNVIRDACRKSGVGSDRPLSPEQFITGLGAIEATKLALRPALGRTAVLAFDRGALAGIAALPLAVTAVAGITLKCSTEVTLYSKQSGTETEYDGPGGDNAATVQRNAKSLAEDNAKTNVTNDLQRQAAMIQCPAECSKQVGVVSTTITTAGAITASSVGGSVYDWYTGTAEAEGNLTVKCA